MPKQYYVAVAMIKTGFKETFLFIFLFIRLYSSKAEGLGPTSCSKMISEKHV